MVKVYSHLAEADVRVKHRRYSPMDRLDLKGVGRVVHGSRKGKRA